MINKNLKSLSILILTSFITPMGVLAQKINIQPKYGVGWERYPEGNPVRFIIKFVSDWWLLVAGLAALGIVKLILKLKKSASSSKEKI